jgi:hypothetical protein
MAATQWAFYIDFRRGLGEAGFNMGTDPIKLALFKSVTSATKSPDTETLSLFSQLSSECTGGNYSAGGKSLSNTAWAITDTSIYKFDSDNWIITASGSSITSIKFAVLYKSASAGGGPLICWSQLSTTQISVTTGNTLTVQMATGGIFTLA